MIACVAGPPAHLWNSSGLCKTNRHSPSTVRPKSLSTDEKSSLIPQTLEELDADLELQNLHRQIAQQGQVQLTKQEEKKRLRSLARLGSPSFELACQQHSVSPLVRGETTVLQLNIGLYCNQACRHCHVESSPRRTELMSEEVAKRCVELIDASDCIRTLDLTGGAPELCPQFRYLVEQGAQRGLEVIDRCNLTVLEEPGQEDLGEFLARHGVRVVASLPCYTAEVVDAQRGRGVQGRSIRALKSLNSLGYGLPGSPLKLDLVYNPDGVFLAPSQQKLEAAYRQELWEAHGIQFSSLLCLNNMPIKRWADELIRRGRLEEYMELLVNSFNAAAAEGIMCRNTLSVGWDGRIFDCDFNQQLDIGLPRSSESTAKDLKTVFDLGRFEELMRRPIAVASHCYGCTAGEGSSCQGATS